MEKSEKDRFELALHESVCMLTPSNSPCAIDDESACALHRIAQLVQFCSRIILFHA